MLSLLLLGCAADTDGDLAGADPLQAEREALAEEVWADMAGYETWGQADPWTGIQPTSDGSHGDYVQIWLDDTALASLGAAEAAVGSTVVKRAYADAEGAEPAAGLTVMRKLDSEAVAETGWLWIALNAESGVISKAEDSGGCASCHASGTDYRRMLTDTPGGG